MKESDKKFVNGLVQSDMTLGEKFVIHYPLMFSEDIKWWAEELDNFFRPPRISDEICNEIINKIKELTLSLDDSSKFPDSYDDRKYMRQIIRNAFVRNGA